MSNEMDALNKAKLDALSKENEQLNHNVRVLSGQLRARQQGAGELFEANNNLRAAMILLEDEVNKLRNENAQLKAMLSQLEKEKTEWLKSQESAPKPLGEADC